ncbi:MAG: TlpA disulfide reductase family protein, partial [Acidobacteriota bacterium]
MTINDQRLKAAVLCLCTLLLFTAAEAQKRPGLTKLPPKEPVYAIKVTRLDDAGLEKLLRPKEKPLLINFWATWCDPCREEFPELVKLDSEYKGKIDFVTVS